MSFELQQAAEAALRAGERLLWSGQPNPQYMARKSLPVLFALIAGSVLSVVALLALYILDILTPVKLGVGAVVFWLLIGLIVFGDAFAFLFIWSTTRKAAAKTLYVLTNERIIVLYVNKQTRVTSYSHADIQEVRCMRKEHDVGDVVLVTKQPNVVPITLAGISGLSQVEDLLTRIRTKNM